MVDSCSLRFCFDACKFTALGGRISDGHAQKRDAVSLGSNLSSVALPVLLRRGGDGQEQSRKRASVNLTAAASHKLVSDGAGISSRLRQLALHLVALLAHALQLPRATTD